MRGTWVSVVSVLRGMRTTPGDGAWNVRFRYGQQTCTAKYGRVNSVVNVRELRARFEGMWTYQNERFSRYWETIYQWFPDIAKTFMDLLLSENIYWFWKYFPISVIISVSHEILDKCPLNVPSTLYWHGSTLIPTWISNHMPGKMWDEIAYTFPNSKGV